MGAGAGFNALAQAGAQAGLDKIERKRNALDEERQLKATDLINTRNSILTKLPTLLGPNGEKTPEYDQAYQSLTQAQEGLGQLYHPDKAPGALQSDWHWLLGKMHGITAPKDKTPPSAPPQASSVAVNTPAPPSTTPAIPADPSVGQDAVPATTMPGMNSVPKGATPTMAVAKPKGLVEAGTIPIWNRPSVLNDDGTHSSELSISMGDDKGNQVLIPLIVGGKFLTPDGKMPPGPIPHNAQEWEKASPEWKALKMRAWQNYEKTGEHLGKFGGDTAEDDVDAYAQVLHNRGSAGATTNLPVAPSPTVTKAPAPSWGQAQVLKHKAASMQKAQQEANLLASGAPLSPEQQASADARAEAVKQEMQINSTLAIAKKLGIEITPEELKQKMGFKSFALKPIPGAGGQPVKQPDGTYARPMSTSDNTTVWEPMPAGWKPNTKAIAGGIVNTKQHGYVKIWVDPYNPSKILGYQKITPGRQYTGSTSSSTATDAAGVTTSTSRSTMPTNTAPVDMDFSEVRELPESYNGEDIPTATEQPSTGAKTPSGSPNKSPAPTPAPPKSVSKPATGATPAQLKSQIPAPPSQTTPTPGGHLEADENGHIPENALGLDGKPINSQIREAANQLLDGVAMKDVTIAAKDKPTAEAVARKYGWGQGPYLPRELKMMQNADQFLDQALNSKAFMRAIDEGVFRKTATALAQKDSSKEGTLGTIMHQLAQGTLNDDQKEYLNIRQAIMGTVSGLSSIVRTGRPTEATINRLAQEIPDVMSSADSKQAKEKIEQIKKELKVALAQGVPAPVSKDKNSAPKGAYELFLEKHSLSDPSIKK